MSDTLFAWKSQLREIILSLDAKDSANKVMNLREVLAIRLEATLAEKNEHAAIEEALKMLELVAPTH